MAGITVMGAGILGLSVAFALARRGARVMVFEASRVGAGASGGLVGALAPHAPENWNATKQFQLESLLTAESFWAEVARIGRVDPGYARLGRLQPLPDEAAVVRARARERAAGQLWQGRAEWRVIRASAAPGLVPESATGLLALDTLSARLAPRQALAALVAALNAMGVTVAPGSTPPEGASVVIWATGAAGLADLGAALGVPVGGPVKGQAALLDADWRRAPQIYAPGLHLVPHADGTLAVGSTSERDFDDPAATDEALDHVIARARALCPALAHAPVLARWAGLRPRASTRHPVLGPWPGRAGHFVLNGGFKTGFGMAPKLAGVMADLVLKRNDARPPGMALESSLPAAMG